MRSVPVKIPPRCTNEEVQETQANFGFLQRTQRYLAQQQYVRPCPSTRTLPNDVRHGVDGLTGI